MDTPLPPSQAAVADTATQDKTVAVLSSVTILGFIAALIVHQTPRLGAFHLRQTLAMVVTGLVSGVCGVVPILRWHPHDWRTTVTLLLRSAALSAVLFLPRCPQA